MGTLSYYIANELDAQMKRRLQKMAKDEGVSVSTLITRILAEYLSQHTANQPSKNWASKFCGIWQDDRTAKEIIDDIEKHRSKTNFDIFK